METTFASRAAIPFVVCDAPLPDSATSAVGILEQMRARYDASSPRAGRLVCVSRFLYLHYAVALSETHVVGWHPERKGAACARGIFRIEPLTASYRLVDDDEQQNRADLLHALWSSPAAFHLRWDYCVRTWNCEHWARLVTSGVADSVQCERSAFGLARFLGGRRRNSEAAPRLQSAIEFTRPDFRTAPPARLAA